VKQRRPTLSIAIIATGELRRRCQTILARSGEPRLSSRSAGLAGGPQLVRRYRPSVIVLDAVDSPLQALKILSTLKRLRPTAGVILLSRNGTRTIVLESLRRGAWGHLTEREIARHLPKAVRTVAIREPWLPRQFGALIVAELQARHVSDRRPSAPLRLIRGGQCA
jgi:DNA-binding NarL/FixJ family response regulator